MACWREGPIPGARGGPCRVTSRILAVKKWARWLLFLSLLGLLGVGALRWAVERQLPAEYLQAELAKSLGFPVRFRAFRVSWDARLVLEQLELLDPASRPFLMIDQVELDFDQAEALHGKLVLLKMRLEHPQLEMSRLRWRSLAKAPSRPSRGRNYPILLKSLDLRWLDEGGTLSWEIKDWQGSLPPVVAGQWRVALQSPVGEAVEAEGSDAGVRLRVVDFSVVQLVSLATGSRHPGNRTDAPLASFGIESEARVNLDGFYRAGQWDLKADLRSQAFRGPFQLIWNNEGTGKLTTPGGELSSLGRVGPCQVPFQVALDGWDIGPAQLRWRDRDWLVRARIRSKDRFWGELSCQRLVEKLPAGFKFSQPPRVRVAVQGSVQRKVAEYELECWLPGLSRDKVSWGDWRLGALGSATDQGIPDLKWELHGPRGRWPGEFSWNRQKGDLSLRFKPVRLQQWLPGLAGELSGSLQRRGAEEWNARLSLPRLQWKSLVLTDIGLQLAGRPARWSGQARGPGIQLTLSGVSTQPQLDGSVTKWSVADLKGALKFRLSLGSPQQLRLEVLKHDLRWKKYPLPQVRGTLLGTRQGWRSQDLKLVYSSIRLPVTLSGGWNVRDWKLQSQFKSVSLEGLAAVMGLKPKSVGGQVSGEIQANWRELACQGSIQGLTWESQKLGDWKLTLQRPKGQRARVRLSSQALPVAGWGAVKGLGQLKTEWTWTEGQAKVRGIMAAPHLQWGSSKLGPLSLKLEAQPGSPVLKLDGSLGPVGLGGQLLWKSRQLALRGKLEKLALNRIPGVPLGLTGSLSGQWRLNGSWTRPLLEFKGELSEVKFLQWALATLPVDLKADMAGESNFHLGPLALEELATVQKSLPSLRGSLQLRVRARSGQKPALEGEISALSLQDRPIPSAHLKGIWSGARLDDVELTWKLTPVFKAVGWLGLTSHLEAVLEGQSLADLALGQFDVSGKAWGRLLYDAQKGVGFQGEVRELVVAGQSLGEGKLNLTAGDPMKLRGQDFLAEKVGILQQRYPGMRGQLSFEVIQGKDGLQGSLDLGKANWGARSFPDLKLEAYQQAESWPLSRVEVALEPPLTATGRLWPARQRLELQGKFSGQSLADLTMLAGGSRVPEVSAALVGDFRLASEQKQLNLSFQGQARNLIYRGVALGEGHLSLQANPELQGELILVNPLELSQVAQVPAALKSVLPLGNGPSLLRLRGVKLGGSLEAPQATPLWSAPKLPFKLPFP